MKLFMKKPAHPDLRPESPVQGAVGTIQVTHLINLAVEVWRVRERLKKLLDSQALEDPALTFSLDAVFQSLKDIGIEIKDPKGEHFYEGMSLDVLAFDYPDTERPEIRIVQETIAPGVYLCGTLVKLAQVIIGKGDS